MKSVIAAAGIVVAGLLATPASAAVYVAASNVVAQTMTAATFLSIGGDSASTGVTFTVPAAGIYALSLAADCSVSGNTAFARLDILIDGLVQNQTAGSSNAFCSADGSAALDRPGLNTAIIALPLTSGRHVLKLRVAPSSPGATVRIDNVSAMISD